MYAFSVKSLLLGLTAVLAVLLPACGNADASAPADSAASELPLPQAPQRLVRRLNHSQLSNDYTERMPIE